MKPPSRFDWSLVAGATLAALVLRIVLWSTQSIVSVDGTSYIRMGQSLSGGAALESVHPWGYPVLIFLAHLVEKDWVLAARIVDLVAGVAVVPLTWLLARSYVTNRWLCLFPAILVAFLPLTVRYSLTTMSEAPYLVLLLVMFILAARERPLLGGLVGGLAYLIRPEALTAVIVLALFSFRIPRRAGMLLAGAALVVVPYVVGQGVTTGVWTLSQKTINVDAAQWWEKEPRPGESPESSAGLAQRLGDHGSETLSAYPGRLMELATQLVRHGGWVVVLVSLAGLLGPAAVLAAGVSQILVTPIFSLGGHARFVLPFLPFVWVLAAAAMDRVGDMRWRLALGAVCLAGLALTVVREFPAYTVQEDGDFPELVEAGQWLAPYVGPSTVIYDRKPYTAFYAGASYRTIPMGTHDEILDAIVAEGGDYLVVDQGVVDFFRPMLIPMAIDKAVSWHESRTRPVYINVRYANRKTVVYRVVRPGGPPPLPHEPGMREQMAQLTHQSDHLLHGMLAMRGENWQTAAGEFNSAIRADSSNTVALNNRAWCLVKAEMALGNAEDNARRAVMLAPDNPDYLDTLVEVLRARGKTDEAEKYRAEWEAMVAAEEPEGD